MTLAAPPNPWPIHHPLKWKQHTRADWRAWSLRVIQVEGAGAIPVHYATRWVWPGNRNSPYQLVGDAVPAGVERTEFHQRLIDAKREAQRLENQYLDWFLGQAAAAMELTDGQLIAAIKTKSLPDGKACCLICGRQPFVAGPGGCVFQRYGLCTKCFKMGVRA